MFLISIRLNKCLISYFRNSGTLKSVPDCYKNQQLSEKSIGNYPHALEFVPECYKTQKMCDKAVDTHPSIRNLFLNAIRLKRFVIKQSVDVFLYLILFLINRKLKKYVI